MQQSIKIFLFVVVLTQMPRYGPLCHWKELKVTQAKSIVTLAPWALLQQCIKIFLYVVVLPLMQGMVLFAIGKNSK